MRNLILTVLILTGAVIYAFAQPPSMNEDGIQVEYGFTACADISLRLFLEGPYQSSGTMTTVLNKYHLLPGMNKNKADALSIRLRASFTPFGHPYTGPPWNYSKDLSDQFGEAGSPGAPTTVQAYDDDVTDWVLVSVRKDGLGSDATSWTCAGWVHSSGIVTFPYTCPCLTIEPNREYFIFVDHRNHLGVLTPQAIETPKNGMSLFWDFTKSDSYHTKVSFGQKEIKPGIWAMFASNGDHKIMSYAIDNMDRVEWKNSQNGISYLLGDFNLNGIVNSEDDTIWKVNDSVISIVAY